MSPPELHSLDLNLHKEIKAIRNFFSRSSVFINSEISKCDLCLLPLNCESPFISDSTFAVIRHSFLINLSTVSYSPNLCPECAKCFIHLSGLFHELSRLRSEFNSCRRALGRRIISTSVGTPGNAWEEEISKTENTYPCCLEIKYKEINLSKDELDGSEELESSSSAFIIKEEGNGASETSDDDIIPKEDSFAQNTHELPELEEDKDLTEMDLEDVYYIDDDDDNDVKYDPNESKYFSDEKQLVENRDTAIEPISTDLINSYKEKLPISSVVSSMAKAVQNEQVQAKLNQISWNTIIKEQQRTLKPNKKARPILIKKDQQKTLQFRKKAQSKSPTFKECISSAEQNSRSSSDEYTPTEDSNKANTYKCKLCPEVFTAYFSLSRHTLRKHDTQETKCPSCPEIVCGQKALRTHQKEQHGSVMIKRLAKHKCTLCSQSFTTNFGLLQHLENIHSQSSSREKYNCNYCERKFLSEKILKKHEHNVHLFGAMGREERQCPLCLKYLCTEGNVEKHKRRRHFVEPTEEPSTEILTCFICQSNSGSIYATIEELKEHGETEEHKASQTLCISVHCNVCKINFDGEVNALQVHLKSAVHKKEAKLLGKFDASKYCVPCRKQFDSSADLNSHAKHSDHTTNCEFRTPRRILKDQKDSTLLCHACPKVFKRKTCLETHVKSIHVNKEPRRKRGRRKLQRETEASKRSDLKLPTKETDRGNQYICPHCPYSRPRMLFMRKHLYKIHPKEYLKDNPVICKLCYNLFKSEEELKEHEQIHGNMTCYFCGKCHLFYSNLKAHMSVHTRETGVKSFASSLGLQ